MALWNQSPHRFFQFDVFEVDLWTGELCKEGAKLKIQEQPLKILAMLLARAGELVTREQLREGLWSSDTFVDFDRGLNTAVNRLRSALNDSAETPRFIETVGSRGYRFIAPVTGRLPDRTETTSQRTGLSDGAPTNEDRVPPNPEAAVISTLKSQVRDFPSKWSRAVALLILVTVGAIGYGIYRWRSHIARSPDFENLRLTKLTGSGRAEDAAISPDGNYVVYAQRDQNGVGLWVRHVASRSEVQILPSEDVDFRGLTFSPDGNFVFFVRTRKEIGAFKDLYVMPVLGGRSQLLTRDIDSPISFSPNGRQFVYTEGFGPPYGNRIRIANEDGSQDRVLAEVDGTSPNFHAGPAWSPDGRTIVVSLMLRGDRSGYVLDVVSPADGRVQEVFWHAGAIGRPVWLPDSQTVLAELDGSTGLGQLWTISVRGGRVKRVTNDLANWGLRIDATHDAQTVSGIQWSVMANLWSAPLTDLSKTRQITSGELPMIAAVERPDGKLLAVSGNNDLWVVNKNGTDLSPFSNLRDVSLPVMCGDFVVVASYLSGASPDDDVAPGSVKAAKLASGRMIVQRSYQSGPVNIIRVDRMGLNPTTLARGFLYSPACSSDGKFVFYVLMKAKQSILRVPIQGGDPEILGSIPGQTIRGTMRISPDGRFLAFPYDTESPEPSSKLAVVSAETGETVKTYDAPGGIYRESCLRWSPDGKGLQYLLTTGDVTNIWNQPVTGGPRQQLTKFTSGRIFDFNWSANGKQLFLARGEVTSDVVLLTNSH